MEKQKLQAKTFYCLGYAKGFSGRSRKGGGGFQGVHPPVEMNLHVQKCFSNLLTICFEVEIVTTEGSHRRSIICVQY